MLLDIKKFYLRVGIAIVIIAVLAFSAIKLFRLTGERVGTEDVHFEDGTIEEAGKMNESKSSIWWVNSGGLMTTRDGVARTNFGDLEKDSKWRKLYKKNNSRDTEEGKQPQNIFRLVTRSKWQNLTQQVYFKVDKLNLSQSDYRNESNGVLLFNRYRDGDNLYYTGLRVDGHAVIKKKVDEKYYTMAEKSVLTNSEKYDRIDNPNLIPLGKWIGIKSEVSNVGKDTVKIKLYIDKEGNGNWQLAVEAEDKSGKNGKSPIMEPGYGGIRIDFMDVSFKGYRVKEVEK